MKRMNITVAFVSIVLFSAPVISQELSSLTFLHAIGQKESVTIGDAAFFFMIALNEDPGAFNMNVITLRHRGVLKDEYYDRDAPLSRGLLAQMAASHLHLKGSFLYSLFGTERYAVRACVDAGIMNSGVSEWDHISGSELIEVMGHVSGARR